VRLPPVTHNNVTILSGGSTPEWILYLAELASNRERISIWQRDVDSNTRTSLLARANEAFTLTSTAIPNITREVALHLAAQPIIDVETATQLAQPITSQHRALLRAFDDEHYFTADKEPIIGVIDEGRLFCLAHSARRTSRACELGIETLPEARRRGYALAATVLWTAAVAQEGLVPLYSAFAENTASLKLAAAAGYREFARAAYIQTLENSV